MQAVKRLAAAPKRWQMLLICGLLGAATFLVAFGTAPLNVQNDAWIYAALPEGDTVGHYAGWMAFRNSPWSFPLTYTNAFCWPDGTLVAYLDSNPLMCIFFKVLSPFLPATFQFFGIFTFACYILQGVAAGMLVGLFTKKPAQVYPAVLVFTFSPVLMERAFRHTQLTSHFLILWALYYYILMRRQGYVKMRWQFILLNVLSMAIHPYFIPMVMSILVLAVAEAIIKTKNPLRPLGFLAANIGASLAVGWLIGTIGWRGSYFSRAGYGYFSMNLNAPFNPRALGDYRWSFVLGTHPQQSGQYDGFNYLGFGILVFISLIALHFLVERASAEKGFFKAFFSDVRRFIKLRLPLLIMCAFLFLFAVSHVVTLGGRTLLTLPMPQALVGLAGIFRASSRMFWPVYYLVYIFVIRYVINNSKAGATTLLICIMAVLQLGDMAGVCKQKHQYLSSPPPYTAIVNDPFIEENAPKYSHIISLEESYFYYYYTSMAAKYGLTANYGNIYSGMSEASRAAGHEGYDILINGGYAPDTIYIAETPELAAELRAVFADAPEVVFFEYEGFTFIFPPAGQGS